jgi:hypothetical protein
MLCNILPGIVTLFFAKKSTTKTDRCAGGLAIQSTQTQHHQYMFFYYYFITKCCGLSFRHRQVQDTSTLIEINTVEGVSPIVYISVYVLYRVLDYGRMKRLEHVVEKKKINERKMFECCVCVDLISAD